MSPATGDGAISGQNHDRFQAAAEDAFAGQTMVASQDHAVPPVIEISAGQKMLSAVSGSLLTSLLVTPLDVVRVRWQSQGTKQGGPQAYTADLQKLATSTSTSFRPTNLGVTACCREVFFMNSDEWCVAAPRIAALGGAVAPGECAVEETQKKMFNSTMDGLRKIARNEGFTTLWRGLSPTLVMAIPANIIYFTGYDWLRFNARSPIQKITPDTYAPLVAGISARTLAATAVGPIELFKTRLQASTGRTATGHLANTFKGLRDMVAQQGYRSLWRGLTLTLWRDVPFSGMYWFGYETVRGKLIDLREERRGRPLAREDGSRSKARLRSQSRENHTATFMDSFTAGALSGSLASIMTMPFDVGKTRTQVYRDSCKNGASNAAKAGAAPEEQNMIRLLWHIFRHEGIPGLWKGWIPRTLKIAPACAIMISSYEVGKRFFRGINEKNLTQKLQHDREINGS